MDIIDKLFMHDKTCFDVSYEEQAAFLKRLGPAKDDCDRSYKQYRCQMFYLTLKKRVLLSMASVFAFPCVLLGYSIKGLFTEKGERVQAIGRFNGLDFSQIPDVLREKYDINDKYWGEPVACCPRDLLFVLNFWLRYILHPFFVTKTVMKLAKYSGMIYSHSPEFIIVHDEFSFTSSVLTRFCEKHGVKHIDMMHGEKLYYLRDSYFRFHECYVWSGHYINLFRSLNADPNQFKIALPQNLTFDTLKYYSDKEYADYKYYLGIYTEDQIKSVVATLQFAKKIGKTVKFRPHPNYSDINLLKKYVSESEIEYSSVDIKTSIASLTYAVGTYTTVLYQAFLSGKQVILDDMTYKSKYDKLRDLKYVLITHNLPKLSDFQ